jgi:hypothetical protein
VSSPVTDVFAIGRYSLAINPKASKSAVTAAPDLDEGTNDTFASADQLTALNGNDNRFRVAAELEGKSDVDVYRVTAPAKGGADALQVQVWNADPKRSVVSLGIFDAAGNRMAVQVLESQGNKLTYQVLGVQRGESYFVSVRSPAGADASGTYRLSAEFTKPTVKGLTQLDSGLLTADAPRAAGTLTLDSARLVNLSLIVAPLPTNATASLRVLDATGREVGSWAVNPGSGQVDASAMLSAGTYTLEVVVVAKKGAVLPNVGYWLFGGIASDPIGPTAPTTGTLPGTTSPPTNPPPPPPPPSYTYTGSSTTTTKVGYAYKL